MRVGVAVLTVLAYTSHAHREQLISQQTTVSHSPTEQRQLHLNQQIDRTDHLRALSTLLVAFSPAVAFVSAVPQVSLHSARVPTGRSTVAQATDVRQAEFDRRALLLSACASAGACTLKPEVAAAISATTMAGKSKPNLGVFLVDAPKQTGNTISGELILNGGIIASVSFESAWKLAQGQYYDIEASPDKSGDSAFVSVYALPSGKTLSSVPKTFFTDALLGVSGRYGSYGAPVDVKVLGETQPSEMSRSLDVVFSVLSPGGNELARRGVATVVMASGSNDVIMLLSSTNKARWKSGGEQEARIAAESFRITSTRKTQLKAVLASDYREVAKDVDS